VCWLANRLGEFGVTLHANSVVLPGAVCASVAVGHGDRVVADFGPLGTVSIAFGAKEQS
jgi:2-keto-4-pentenoate hydratase